MFLIESMSDPEIVNLSFLIEESSLECESILNEFKFLSSSNTLYTEAATDGTGKVSLLGQIGKFIKKIIQTIKDFIRMIGDMFTTKSNLTAEEYFRTDTLNRRFNSDYNAIDREVRKELVQGHKLIQMIASATGIEDITIQKWVNASSKKIKSVAPVAIPAVTMWGMRKLIHKSFSSDEKTFENAEKDAAKCENDPKKQQQTMSVLSNMQKLISAKMGSAKDIFSIIRKWGKNTDGDATSDNSEPNGSNPKPTEKLTDEEKKDYVFNKQHNF